MRVVLTGCSVREPDRAGLRRRYPAVDLFLRPDEEPELVDRLGLASAQAPIGRESARRRRSSGARSSASPTTWPATRAAGGRGRGPSPAARRSPPGCRSSTAATRPAPTASCRSAAGRSGAARSTTSSTRPGRSPPPATARSRCSARTSTRTATTCRPSRASGTSTRTRWAGRRLDLARPAGPRRAHPRDRRAADRRRAAGDRAPALRHVAPVGPVGPADRRAGRLRSRSASTSTCRSSRATTPSCAGWAASTRSSTTSSGSTRIREAVPGHHDLDRRHRRVLRRDRGPVRGDARRCSRPSATTRSSPRPTRRGPGRRRRTSPTTCRRPSSAAA